MRHTRIGSQVVRWSLPALLIAYATLHRLGQTYGSTFTSGMHGCQAMASCPNPGL